ncbi:MAG TPA: amino acid racemase [Rhizomicrobium sp.]|jgi:aspartate racemase|nr:amino acid racemase [Rhizomicrobium sp.]
MKTIGMLGGMSWESTTIYYQSINREVQKRLGGVHSAKLLIHSCDFAEMAVLQKSGDWDAANAKVADAARSVASAGADFLLIACNTMHTAAAQAEKAAGCPLLHIADPLGEAIRKSGATRVGLLGSQFTMTRDDVLRGTLATKYSIDVIVPEGEDARETDRVIYEELIRGKFLESSRAAYRDIMARLVRRGADAIILGCTEIPLLVKDGDASVPTFDTTTLHAMAAVDRALA